MVVEGAVVRSAKDKPVSWVISPPVAVCTEMSGIE